MIKYHGTPLTPISVFEKALKNRNALISFSRREDFNRAVKLCDSIMIDNGAFSFWTKGKKIDWEDYYRWIDEIYPTIDYFIIPDVIDGSEIENDQLIANYFKRYFLKDEKKAIPVWHIHESLERLQRLIDTFDYIAFGSSGEFSELGSTSWIKRMDEAMRIVCNDDGTPKVKIHMLRCLNPKIFTQYPFYSGDSTNLARNHKRDGYKKILQRLEKYNSPLSYRFKTFYKTVSLFEVA